MSWNGVGVFNRIFSWVADDAAHINITASRMDADTNDITSNGFGNCLTRDGQGGATANLPMNSFRHTGAGLGVAGTDYATMSQVQAGMTNWVVATGTADALAASYSPALAALVDGQYCFVRAGFANATTTPTFSPNGLTARTITKLGGTAIAIGDIAGAGAELILRYNLASTRWELLNPATVKGTTFWCGAAGGTANAITFTDPNFNNQDGYLLSFRATATNNAATTANGIAVVKDTTSGPAALSGTEIITGNIVTLSYDANATEWHISAPLTLVGSAQLLTSALGVGAPINLQLNAAANTPSANLLQISVKGNNGSDPSPTNPVLIPFRDATVANGDPVFLTLTAALSINTNATGATLGSANSTAFRFWVVVFNNGGTPVLALINCLNPIAGITSLNDRNVASSTAISGGATSTGVFYTPNGTTVSSKAFCVLGYVEYNATGLATAGTYNVAPQFVQLAGANTPRPGQEVQRQFNFTGAVNSGTTALPNDDTIPQNAEGDQYMTQAITPTSAANLLDVDHLGNYSMGATPYIGIALFQDATANAIAASFLVGSANTWATPAPLRWMMQASIASSTTFKIRAGSTGGATVTFNGQTAARKFGGVMSSYLQVREIMA
jgi:hypothetical protein